MAKDMKLIMENWKRYEQYHDLFERHNHIKYCLGFEPLLNESGAPYYSEEMKQKIIEEHILFEGFLDAFNPIQMIKKYGEEVGQLFATLGTLIKSPEHIPQFIRSAKRKIIAGWVSQFQKAIQFLESKNMPTFAKLLKKVVAGIKAVVSDSDKPWKTAIKITGVIIGVTYLHQQLKKMGADLSAGADLEASLSERVVEAVENWLINEWPKVMAKLYGAGAVAGSFAGWVVGAVAIVKVVNLAKKALKPLFANFEMLVQRKEDGAIDMGQQPAPA